MRRTRARRTATLAAVALALLAAPGPLGAQGFSEKPVYLDPALKGWVAPLQTLLFQVGCGEFYCVYGVYLGERRELNVFSKSTLTLRRFEQPKLQRFADKLANALAPVVNDLGRKGMIDGVVMTFYAQHLKGNVMELEVYESCVPARAAQPAGSVPLCLVERRREEVQPP